MDRWPIFQVFSRYPVSVKIVISLLACAYLVYLILGLLLSWLGPNPIEVLIHQTGEWGLNFLVATLAINPLRRHFHWNHLIKYRRFLGLWGFAFISLHLLVFAFFDHFFNWTSIWEDVIERPYITVGFLGFLLMVPLAITSFKALQRRLGKRWVQLHRLFYVVVVLAVVHYWWLVKADILLALIYGLMIALLLLDRTYFTLKKVNHNHH